MKDSTRGGVIVIVIVLALVAYFAIWMPGCDSNVGSNRSSGGGSGSPSRMVKGQTAPDFEHVTIDGTNIKLSDYIGEKPVVLDFFATWCGPCIVELPVLQQFYQGHSNEVEIIAISSEESGSAGAIRSLISSKGVSFPIIHDPSRGISNKYPTRGIPYLVFIDKDGIVISDHLGSDPKIGDAIIEEFGL